MFLKKNNIYIYTFIILKYKMIKYNIMQKNISIIYIYIFKEYINICLKQILYIIYKVLYIYYI